MEVSQGHILASTGPIGLKLGKNDVLIKYYRSRHKTNSKTNFLKVRYSKTNSPKTGQNSVNISRIDLKLGRRDVREEY